MIVSKSRIHNVFFEIGTSRVQHSPLEVPHILDILLFLLSQDGRSTNADPEIATYKHLLLPRNGGYLDVPGS